MGKNDNTGYRNIRSFKELHCEIERLELKGKLTRTRLRLDVYQMREALSLSNLLQGLLNDFGLGYFFDLVNKIKSPENE